MLGWDGDLGYIKSRPWAGIQQLPSAVAIESTVRVQIAPARKVREPAVAVVEGEDSASHVGGLSAFEETVLGQTSVGTWVLLQVLPPGFESLCNVFRQLQRDLHGDAYRFIIKIPVKPLA